MKKINKKCKSDIVCEYITNCVECMRLLLYKELNLQQPDEQVNNKIDQDQSNNDKIFSVLPSKHIQIYSKSKLQ